MLFSCMQSRPVWGTLAMARPIRSFTSGRELPPVIAAEQLLPPGKLEIVSFVDSTFGSPLVMRSRNVPGTSADSRTRLAGVPASAGEAGKTSNMIK